VRNCFLFILFLLLFTACGKKDRYVIHGNLRCVSAKEVYMLEMNQLGEMVTIDSTTIHNGDFKFRGHVEYPTMRFIRVGSGRPFDVFVENEEINIRGSVLYPDEITVSGSNSQAELNFLMSEYKNISNKRSSILVKLSNAKKQRDPQLVKTLTKHYETLPDSLLSITERFVASNPTSIGAAYFVCSLSESFSMAKLESIIKRFDPSIANSQYVKYLNDELALTKKFAVGSEAPDFNLTTIEGDSITLEKYKGKYLYIDFGASWCKETAERNEVLLDLYHRYHPMGLEILSVSLDSDEDEWHDFACREPELPWEQASDLLYWASPITKQYRINQIPYGVLVSPEGEVLLIDDKKINLGNHLRKKFGR
jgi:Glutathione peroxidase